MKLILRRRRDVEPELTDGPVIGHVTVEVDVNGVHWNIGEDVGAFTSDDPAELDARSFAVRDS